MRGPPATSHPRGSHIASYVCQPRRGVAGKNSVLFGDCWHMSRVAARRPVVSELAFAAALRHVRTRGRFLAAKSTARAKKHVVHRENMRRAGPRLGRGGFSP